MNLTRREFLKIIGTGILYLLPSTISNLSNISNGNILNNHVMQLFSTTIIHNLSDSDNGIEFIIPAFPRFCIIKEIRVRSNFTAGQQNWRVAFVDNDEITPTDTNILCKTAEIFEAGDYIFIGDEIAYVEESDSINNTMIVKRGMKGTVPMYHIKDTRMETTNNGLRIILSKNRNVRLTDSINMDNIMTWKGIVNSLIMTNDKYIILEQPPVNLIKYDTIFINDGFDSERISIVGVYNTTKIYVKDSILSHSSGTEIQKQVVYDVPMIYSGEEDNLYGILYIDEKINNDVVVNIEIVAIFE